MQHIILADIRINGRTRKVHHAGAEERLLLCARPCDRRIYFRRTLSDVNWARGIDPKTGRPIENPEARYGFQPVTLYPGPLGAHNWAPMSFNPNTGLVYLPAGNNSAVTHGSKISHSRSAQRSSQEPASTRRA